MKCSRGSVKIKLLGGLLAGYLSIAGAFAAPSFQDAVNDYNSGKYARALGTLQAVKASYPNNALVHYYIALCQQSIGHLDQARSEFQWVVASRDPRLSAMAATGLAQLAGARTSGSGGGGTAAVPFSASGGGKPATSPRVKKILEFWAEW